MLTAPSSPTIDFGVEVRTRLRSANWRHLERVAARHQTTVAALVSEIVRRHLDGQQLILTIAEKPSSKAAQKRLDDDQSIRELHAGGATVEEICAALSMGKSKAYYRLRALGLSK